MSGNALALFHEQFHQPEDRFAIRVRRILLWPWQSVGGRSLLQLHRRHWPDMRPSLGEIPGFLSIAQGLEKRVGKCHFPHVRSVWVGSDRLDQPKS